MVIDDTTELENILAIRDLEALCALCAPAVRIPNRSNAYRSALMLSAHNLKHLNKIDELEAECVMLNLEDGVSEEEKPFALHLCAYFLSRLPKSPKKLVVRVNPLDEGGSEEITLLNAYRPDAIRIPKVRSVNDVKRALELLDNGIELHLSIETKEAWLQLSALACDPRVKAYYIGFLDLFADLGLPHSLITPANPTLHYMLSHFLVSALAAGVKPVSFVFQDYKDMETFEAWLNLEKQMGFTAKGCLSPAQVSAVNRIFGLDENELLRAKEIVRLFEAERAQGVTGFVHAEYGFIDEPIYKGALALLAANN